MTWKTEVGILIAAILTAFAVGRASVPAPEIKTDEITKTDTKAVTDKDTHTVTSTVVTEKPTGEKTTTIFTTTDTTTKKTKETDSSEKLVSDVIPPKTGTVHVLALVGTNTTLTPIYGLSVSKQFIGPVNIGVWGLSNATGGVSVGLDF